MIKFLKKIFIFFIIVLLFLIGIFLIFKYKGSVIFEKYAEKMYKEKDYQNAYIIYDLIPSYYHGKNYEYEKALCLSKMPMTYSVQKKLVEVAQRDDNSKAEKLATKLILKYRKRINDKYGQNYIKDTLLNNVVVRWSMQSFPISYYIETNDSTPEYYGTVAEGAFADWARETDDFISFVRVKNPASAKIYIKFYGRPDIVARNDKTTYEIATTTPVLENSNIIKQMEINCYEKTHENKFLTQEQLKTVMAHEIGHAIGFWGHTEDNKTIMYSSLNNSYNYYENRIDTSLNEKDIATLKLLYALAPDVCDNPSEFEINEKYIYPDILFAPLDNAQKKMLEKARQLLTEHPGDVGYALTLVDAYNTNKMYKEGIKLMQMLLTQTKDRNLQSLLSYNIANNYILLQDFDNALFYANNAIKYSNTLDNRCLAAYVKFCRGDYNTAEKEFMYILSKQPSHLNASLGLADIYIKQKNFSNARKVLKELIKNNPNALNNKAIEPYKVFIMF